MIDSIEELLQVEINAPAAALSDILLCLRHCLMSRPPRSKTVAVIGKLRVPPPLQNLHDRLLDESIQHRRDAQLAHSAVRLRYLYPLHRLWSVRPVEQLFPDGWPVLFQVVTKLVDRHCVNARRTFVRLDPS